MGKIGSEVIIHRRRKCDGLTIFLTTDDQTPNSKMARVSNPGRAIINIDSFKKTNYKQ